MEWTQIGEKINESGPGYRINSALFFGATRKYHRRDVPHMGVVDDVMDRVEDADEETITDFSAALMACFFRGNKETWRKILLGEPLEDEDADEPDEPDEPDEEKGSEEEVPKEAPKSDSESS